MHFNSFGLDQQLDDLADVTGINEDNIENGSDVKIPGRLNCNRK